MVRNSAARLSYHDLSPDTGDFRKEVIAGLSQPQKTLAPKFFYDKRGSQLFEAICELPEYYPTRTEIALMREKAPEMARCLGMGCVLIEYGSGSGRKTRILVEALAPAAYVPIDIASQQLRLAAQVVQLPRELHETLVLENPLDADQPRFHVGQAQINRVVCGCHRRAAGNDRKTQADKQCSHR